MGDRVSQPNLICRCQSKNHNWPHISHSLNQKVKEGVKSKSEAKSKLCYDVMLCYVMFVDEKQPLWREEGSVILNCCWASPAYSRDPRDS
jgi:hypothetical protein